MTNILSPVRNNSNRYEYYNEGQNLDDNRGAKSDFKLPEIFSPN